MSDSSMTQKCLTCGEVKSLEDFFKSKKKSGYESSCKKCKIARMAERYLQKRISKGLHTRAFTHRQNLELKENGFKYCPKCKAILDLFHFSSYGGKENNAPYCSGCTSDIAKERNLKEESKKKSSDSYRNKYPTAKNAKLLKNYGITLEKYNSLLEEQQNNCCICGAKNLSDGRALSVDHNHETGEVRGLLCSNCNVGLGLFRDSTELLFKAKEYLLKKSKNSVD